MNRTAIPLVALALAACNPGGSYEGKLVDAMTGDVRTGIRVLARADQTTDLTCQVREGTVGPDGVFTIADTCPDTTYHLTLGDDAMLIQDPPDIQGGHPSSGVVELAVWRAPAGSGVFKLADDKLTAIRTFADVGSETIMGTTDKVLYPTKKPITVPTIQPGQWMVLSGKETIDRLQFVPLVADTGVRNFEGDVSIEDHVYVGVKFNSDTEFTREEVMIDESKLKSVTSGDRMVRYMPSDALPQGRFAVLGQNDRRMYVVDFGSPVAPPTAQTE